MNGTGLLPAPSYPDLLRTAYDWGRVDGRLAADFEPLDSARPSSACCRGRDATDFASHLWDFPGGGVPPGLEINAPLWYACGFEEALAEVRADRMKPLVQAARASDEEIDFVLGSPAFAARMDAALVEREERSGKGATDTPRSPSG